MAEKVCEYCGASYQGAPQSRFCSEAHRKAASRAAARPANQADQAERKLQAPKRRDLDADGRPNTLRGLMSAAKEGTIVLSEREEQQIRNHFGFTASEKRTFLEREAAARRIREKLGPLPREGETVTRLDELGNPVEEPVGPAGLSLVAFPNQREGDLAPTPEERAKLG